MGRLSMLVDKLIVFLWVFILLLAFGTKTTVATEKPLIFSVHQPEGSPTFRWLSLVYSDISRRTGIDIKLRYLPAARSNSKELSYSLDGQAGRVFGYQQVTDLIQIPEPLYALNMRAYVRHGSGLHFDSWEGLTQGSLRVEYMRGASLPYSQLNSRISEEYLTSVTSIEQGFRKLKAGRTDVFLASDLSSWPFTTSTDFINHIVQAGVVGSTEFYPYINKKHQMLMPTLTQAIKEMKKEGVIQKYMYQAFGEDVLVIDSYHASFPWTVESRRGLVENLDPRFTVSFYELNTKRTHPDTHQQQADKAWEHIVEQSPDIVVTMDDNALRLLGQRVSDAGLSLVFMGINNKPTEYFESGHLPLNVTGVVERPLLRANIKVIYQLVESKHKRILVMMDDGMTTQALAQTVFENNHEITIDDVVVELWTSNTFRDWKTKVNQLDKGNYDAVIIGSYANLVDENKEHVPDADILEWTNKTSALPIFAFATNGVGKGKAIGGVVISGYDQGEGAAKAVNQILTRGKAPYVLLPKNGIFLFSQSELKRWEIEIPEQLRDRVQLVE